jgi:transmembrane sensor
VRNDGNSVEVVVTEGKVRIEDSGSAARLLTPGAVAVASDVGVSVRHLSVEDAETRLSWREGVLTFRDADLAAAVAEFNRYNLQKIVIADPAVASLKVEGNFRPTNAEAFIRLLELGFPVRASREGDRIILVSR